MVTPFLVQGTSALLSVVAAPVYMLCALLKHQPESWNHFWRLPAVSTPSLALLCCSREVSLPAQGDPPSGGRVPSAAFCSGLASASSCASGRAGPHVWTSSGGSTFWQEALVKLSMWRGTNSSFLQTSSLTSLSQVFLLQLLLCSIWTLVQKHKVPGDGTAKGEARAALQLVMPLYTFKCTSSQRPFPKVGSNYIYSGSNWVFE